MIQNWYFYRPSTWKEKNKINLWFSLFWKSPFLQHQECDAEWMWVQNSPSVMLANIWSCFRVSSQTHACVRALWGRDPTFFFLFFWHSIWHSKIWIHNQPLWTSIKCFWQEQYLRTNQTFKTACCSCVRLLCTGEFYPVRSHYGAGFYVLRMWQSQQSRECS